MGNRTSFAPLLTKELKLQTLPQGRRLRVSSNLLRPFGFVPERRLSVTIQGRALQLRPTDKGDIKVHERTYAQRRADVRETVIEIASQSVINQAFPMGWDRAHWTFSPGAITIRPLEPKLFWIRRHFRESDALHAFMALSSGVDARVFADCGFTISAALDWRPPEVRDGSRGEKLAESGISTFLANHRPVIALNEDLTTVDPRAAAKLVRRRIGAVATLSIGLQCDDFSGAKSARLKAAEMSEFRPSSRELGHYALRLIEEIQPASVFIENVPGWHGSEAQAILGAVLRRVGYHVSSAILDSKEFGALTSRRRAYFVASIFPGFEFPCPSEPNKIPLGVHLAGEIQRMRDVSYNKAVQDTVGTRYDRITPLTETTAATVMKSQARQTKDSLYFRDEAGRVLLPTLEALRTLHGIPPDFSFDHLNSETAVEQIGQGIDFPLHFAVTQALRYHLLANKPGQLVLL